MPAHGDEKLTKGSWIYYCFRIVYRQHSLLPTLGLLCSSYPVLVFHGFDSLRD